MGKNHYFNNFSARNEQNLFENLVGELIGMFGITSYYMPRTSESTFDDILGDDPTKQYSESYAVDTYIKTVDDFEGGDLFTKFGIEVRKQVRLIVANREFKKNVPSTYSRPREGDLLWLPNFKALFEIKFVNEETFFYSFGQDHNYGYELICEKFRYNNEKMEVGTTEIEDKIDEIITSYGFVMANTGLSSFIRGETVYQGTDLPSAYVTGTVVAWDVNTKYLEIKNIKGAFAANSHIKGTLSNADWNLVSLDMQDDINSLIDNNSLLDSEANTILNFTETDPFGGL